MTGPAGLGRGDVCEPRCWLLRVTDATDFPRDFAELLQLLGEHGVGVIPECSYGGDYLLIKDERVNAAVAAISASAFRLNDGRIV